MFSSLEPVAFECTPNPKDEIKYRYQIQCAQQVSGINFIRYVQKPNNFKIFGSKKQAYFLDFRSFLETFLSIFFNDIFALVSLFCVVLCSTCVLCYIRLIQCLVFLCLVSFLLFLTHPTSLFKFWRLITNWRILNSFGGQIFKN